MKVGAVYRWSHDDRPMRVLVHDSDVVMYDAWWPHLDNWGLANIQEIRKQRISYYVTTASTLAEKATYVRLDPLTDDELAIHRPDLPFAFGQCAAISWPSEVPGTTAWLAENWRTAGCPNGAMLQASEMYLAPFGPQGGVKAGVRVKAANGTAFTVEELILKAAAVQAPFIGDAVPAQGIGIYRSGLQRGIPAYYLWGSESRLHADLASVARRHEVDQESS